MTALSSAQSERDLAAPKRKRPLKPADPNALWLREHQVLALILNRPGNPGGHLVLFTQR